MTAARPDTQPEATARRHLQVTVRGAGGPEVLAVQTVATPTPGVGELLVRMQAAGVGFRHITQRQGRNPGPMPPVLGYDVVGVVDAVGPDVDGVEVGQRVAALTMAGGYAEQVLAPARWTVAVPEELDAAQVSALVLNYLTAWQLLHRAAGVRTGASIFVHGAAGGVGTALTELARLADVRVYGTASPRHHTELETRGVTVLPDPASSTVRFDATFDPVGGPSLVRSRRITQPKGVVVSYGFSFTVDTGLSRAGGLARAVLAIARAKLTPGPKVVSFQIGASGRRDPAALRADLAHLIGLLAGGTVRPRVQVVPLAQAADAHRQLENRQNSGKLVLVAD